MKGKGGILILVLLICALAAISGKRYYDYTQKDPDFCSLCHLMQEGHRSWSTSRHNQILCQHCHEISLLEENRLLVAFVAGNATHVSQTHGRLRPWDGCVKCHLQDAAQGSLTLRVSYGHARHVFMRNLSCRECHAGASHSFKPDQSRCQKCHSDKTVHGMGTAGLYCLTCHGFGENAKKLVTSSKCFECHGDVPRKGVMSHLECFECHHPHQRMKMESKDCLGSCHGNEVKAGLHGKHLDRVKMECMACHKPHTWVIGKQAAKGLCDRCHTLKNPGSFVY